MSTLLKKPLVNSMCIGCRACVQVAEEVFTIDEETGLSKVKPCENYEGKNVDDAISICPVGAISWE